MTRGSKDAAAAAPFLSRSFKAEMKLLVGSEQRASDEAHLLAGRVMHPIKWDVLADTSRFLNYTNDLAEQWPQLWSGCWMDPKSPTSVFFRMSSK